MKKILALTLLTASLTSLASSRDIFDIMYLPSAGTTFGISDFRTINGSAEGKIFGEKFDVDVSGWSVEQTVGHSLTDRLSLYAKMDYTKNKNEVDVSSQLEAMGASDAENTIKGISDPTVGLRFRALDEAFRLDLIGEATISTGDNDQEGDEENNKQGGSSFKGGVQFGQKSESFQWALSGQVERFLESTKKEDDGSKVDSDAHSEWTFEGTILNKLGESSYLRSNLGFQFTDEYEDENDDKTVSTTSFRIGTEYQHLISKDVLLRLGVTYYENSSAQFEEFHVLSFNAGATYQF